MAEAMKGPFVGERLTLTIDGKVEEFVVNRITPTTAGRGRRLVRVQIDAMAVDEIVALLPYPWVGQKRHIAHYGFPARSDPSAPVDLPTSVVRRLSLIHI